jgi:hypothetical protein
VGFTKNKTGVIIISELVLGVDMARVCHEITKQTGINDALEKGG